SACLASVSRVRYSRGVRSLIVILPAPGTMRTRATASLRRPVRGLVVVVVIVSSVSVSVLRRPGDGLLGLVRMLGAPVHLELAQHRAAERRLGHHAAYRLHDHPLRMLLHRLADRHPVGAARVHRVAEPPL